MSLPDQLDTLFAADRASRKAEARLLAHEDATELRRALVCAVDEAMDLDDALEASVRLTRLADLCAQVQGPDMADALITILGHDDAAVRVNAGEALRDYAYDRYAEVARAIEGALDDELDGPAMEELPWVLAEVGEPSAVPLISRFLDHASVDVVAGAIEALSELGDPAAVPHLETLEGDERVAQLEEGDASYSATLGELAEEALADLKR